MLGIGLGLVGLQQAFGMIKMALQMGCLLDKRLEDVPCLLGIRDRLGLVWHGLKIEDTQIQ
ncbi:hypothetical protein GKODMF_05410 [Candidatus Electrothrix gigas]